MFCAKHPRFWVFFLSVFKENKWPLEDGRGGELTGSPRIFQLIPIFSALNTMHSTDIGAPLLTETILGVGDLAAREGGKS